MFGLCDHVSKFSIRSSPTGFLEVLPPRRPLLFLFCFRGATGDVFHSLGFHTVFQILWIGRTSTIRVRKYTWQGSKMKKQKEKKIIQWHEYSFHM